MISLGFHTLLQFLTVIRPLMNQCSIWLKGRHISAAEKDEMSDRPSLDAGV